MKRYCSTIAPVVALVLAAMPVHAADMKDMPGTKETSGMKTVAAKTATNQTHKGQGTVNSVDAKAGKVNLTHGPIASLNWPGMKMDFVVTDKQALTRLKPGQKVEFKMVEQAGGQYVITEIAQAR